MIPEPWVWALLVLAAFRAWKVIGDDRILDRPRAAVLDRVDDKWQDFIVCPWCAGFWVSGLTYLVWMATLGEFPDSVTDVVVALGVWLSISAAVGLIADAMWALMNAGE